MTSLRSFFICFLLLLSSFQIVGQKELIAKIKSNLSIRNQSSVLQLSRELEKNEKFKVQSHFFQSRGYLFLGNEGLIQYDSSLYYIDEVLKETKVDEELYYEAILFKIHVLLEKGDYKECVKNIQQILSRKEIENYPFRKFELNVELLNLYLRVSDLKNAKLVVDIIVRNPIIKVPANKKTKSYMALGKYYLISGKLDVAKKYYTQALNSFESSAICNKVDAWHMLAEVEKEKGNVNNAMKIYNDLLIYEEVNNYQHGFIHTLLIAAETSLMSSKSKFEMSVNVNKAYQYALKLKNKMRLVQAEMNMGYYFLQIKNTDSAIIFFNKALETSEVIKANYWTRSAARFLVDIYKEKGDYRNAFLFQNTAIEANEKLQVSSQIEKTDLVSNIHKMYTYQHEMEKATFELEKKQIHLIIWITISISAIGISILLFLQYLKQKRHNLFLTEKALKEAERKISFIQPVISEEKSGTKTALDENIYLDLQEKLIAFIDAKGFLDPDCSLTSLAKEFNTNTAYLSKYMNEVLNNSFNQLINEYRILDFIERVKNDKEGRKTFTLDHLASLSGFSSKSTFIRAFKKQTGIAPSAFLKSLEEINL